MAEEDEHRRVPLMRLREFEYTPMLFRERFRLTEEQLEIYLLPAIGADLRRPERGFNLSPKEQILLALKFFATGTFYYAVGDGHGPSKGTVCRAVHRVSDALVARCLGAVCFPADEPGRRRAEDMFSDMAGMPEVIGCVDGTHVNIRVPVEEQERYINRHHDTSLNVLAVAGPQLTFYYASIHAPGRWHDSRVMRTSQLPRLVAEGALGGRVILGDSAYPLLAWLMTPHAHPTTPEQRRYNTVHSMTRATVERAFGLLKMRWRCLMQHLRCKSVQRDIKVVASCFILHNLCLVAGDDGVWLEAAEAARAPRAEAVADAAAPPAGADHPEPAGGEADQRRRGQTRRNLLTQRLR